MAIILNHVIVLATPEIAAKPSTHQIRYSYSEDGIKKRGASEITISIGDIKTEIQTNAETLVNEILEL